MKYAVFGAGLMGRAAVFNLLNDKQSDEVHVFDASQESLNSIECVINQRGMVHKDRQRLYLHHAQLPFSSKHAATYKGIVSSCDAMLSTVPYSYNLDLTNLAIETGTHMNDLGGNNTVVESQFSLSEEAEKAGITVVPDTGLTPGLASILASLALSMMDSVENIKIRVGGLPQNPEGLLKYALVFSVNGLINEYAEPVEVLRNGRKETVEPLTGLEKIDFTINRETKTFEAFMTSGGTSTLPRTLESRIKNLDCKTIRYKGHCKYFKALYDMGLLNNKSIRREIETHLAQTLPKDERDMVIMRVIAEGVRKRRKTSLIYELIDYYDKKTGFTAMQRTTAFTASEITKMLAFGEIGKKGVIEQELYVPAGIVVKRLRDRGIMIKARYD